MLHSVLEEDEQCVRANSPPRCDGHHKMSNWVPSMNRFTVEPRALSYMWRHQRRMVPRCSMETTMSKTTTRHNSEATPEGRELRDDELEHVSGGGKRPDGTGGGNVAGGWDLIANKVHA